MTPVYKQYRRTVSFSAYSCHKRIPFWEHKFDYLLPYNGKNDYSQDFHDYFYLKNYRPIYVSDLVRRAPSPRLSGRGILVNLVYRGLFPIVYYKKSYISISQDQI